MSFIVAIYNTRTEPYVSIAEDAINSALQFNLRVHHEMISDRGSWVKNCAYKPTFILKALNMYPVDVLYIDSDAIIRQYPKLFNGMKADIGIHIMDRVKWHGGDTHPKSEALAGTIFFKNNNLVKFMMTEWINYLEDNPTVTDQDALNIILIKYQKLGLEIYNLPATYTQIYDIMKSAGDPVIEHYQASRGVKK